MGYEILVGVLTVITFMAMLFTTWKMYRNAVVMETPANILQKIEMLEKHLKANALRAAQLESRFRHHIDSNVVPELQRLALSNETRDGFNVDMQRNFTNTFKESIGRISELEAQLSALRQHVGESNSQLRKYQEGYDWTINRTLLQGMVRVLDVINQKLSDSDSPDGLQELEITRDHLSLILEGQNVEEFSPNPGDSYKELTKYAKGIPVPTDDSTKAGKVAHTIKPGYLRLSENNDPRVVQQAEVGVYQLTQVEA